MHSIALKAVPAATFPSSTQEMATSGHRDSMMLLEASNAMGQTGPRTSACLRRGPESTADTAATSATEVDRIVALSACTASRLRLSYGSKGGGG